MTLIIHAAFTLLLQSILLVIVTSALFPAFSIFHQDKPHLTFLPLTLSYL